MQQNEYINDGKVLYKARGKFSLPNKETEEVDYAVTEGHVVIEAQEQIKIPLLRIRSHQVAYESYETLLDTATTEERLGSMKLTYLDDLNQKQNVSLESTASVAVLFNQALSSAIERAKMWWFDSQPVEKMWFARHLNWTLVGSWILALAVYLAFGDYIYVGLNLGSSSIGVSPIINSEAFAGWVLLMSLLIVLPVTGWVLRKKNRSLLNLLWYLVPPPIGGIIMLCLRKEPKIV